MSPRAGVVSGAEPALSPAARATSGGLRRFVAPAGGDRPAPAPDPAHRCELCSAEVPDQHAHVVDLDNRGLLCTCRACWLLFVSDGAAGRRYRAVPERILRAEDLGLAAGEWEALQVPVDLAFFLHSSGTDQVAGFYPSPAGATECLLDLAAWQLLAEGHPMLAEAQPDVEAVLLRRSGDAVECFIVPVDICYELVGRLRLLWQGFDGGEEMRTGLAAFFSTLRERSRPWTAVS